MSNNLPGPARQDKAFCHNFHERLVCYGGQVSVAAAETTTLQDTMSICLTAQKMGIFSRGGLTKAGCWLRKLVANVIYAGISRRSTRRALWRKYSRPPAKASGSNSKFSPTSFSRRPLSPRSIGIGEMIGCPGNLKVVLAGPRSSRVLWNGLVGPVLT